MTGLKIIAASSLCGMLGIGSYATLAQAAPVSMPAIQTQVGWLEKLTPLGMMWVVTLGLVWALLKLFGLFQKRQEEDRSNDKEQIEKITAAMMTQAHWAERMAKATEEMVQVASHCRKNNGSNQ